MVGKWGATWGLQMEGRGGAGKEQPRDEGKGENLNLGCDDMMSKAFGLLERFQPTLALLQPASPNPSSPGVFPVALPALPNPSRLGPCGDVLPTVSALPVTSPPPPPPPPPPPTPTPKNTPRSLETCSLVNDPRALSP
ncbi:hypothetical protein KC19_4G224500 [Ceratodon purpureus]|uniref:Uncharacterized protein n=1 Tax=Ceratodon purpureus TaxID=3225 RepID=A0A8T0IBJ2_CERPU|nr:hypothetical protein KC19_4G224500 [Ceratodon purpureus]